MLSAGSKITDSTFCASTGRLSNKERKQTITEELLADPELSQARKRRFDKLQVQCYARASYAMMENQALTLSLCASGDEV